MDPTTRYDYVLLGFTAVATVPFIAANGVLFWHRKRSYFQAQGGVYLILGSSIAGLVWLIALFFNNGHFDSRSCVLWLFWLQGPGVSMWFTFTVLRLRRIYEISHSIEDRGRKYIFVALCFLPCLTLASVSFLGDFDREESGRHYCSLGEKWLISYWAVYTSYWVLVVAAMIRMRNHQHPHLAKEYTHSFEYVAVALVVVLLCGIAVITGASNSIFGRCFLTFSSACLVYSYFWICFGWPVYLFLFRPKEEMERFEQELTQSGARALDVNYSQRLQCFSSEGAIWEAFLEASEELGRYKAEIQKMEAHKLLLEGKIRKLQLKKINMTRAKLTRLD